MTGASAGKTDRIPGWPGPERLTEFLPLSNSGSGSGPTCAFAGVCWRLCGFCYVYSTGCDLGGKMRRAHRMDGREAWLRLRVWAEVETGRGAQTGSATGDRRWQRRDDFISRYR